jgi:diadenosine tetraphosphatase ApaH/serine/threonine PP2A family protein phosphatase
MTPHSRNTVDSDPASPRRIALLSDVHGNLPAFQAVIDDLDTTGVEETWCLGDLVGYGAEPDECVALAAERCDLCLVGNHDLVVLEEIDIADFSAHAAAAARWTRERIGDDAVDYLGGLDRADESHAIGLYHASPRDPVWEYVLSTRQAEQCMDEMGPRVGAVGHSHVALYFHDSNGSEVVGRQAEAGVEVNLSSGRWLINPGGVGQPRDGDPRAAWLLLDLERTTAAWRRVEYPIDEAARAIEEAGLPAILSQRLYSGQ